MNVVLELNGKLLLSVVQEGLAEQLVDKIKTVGVRGSTILLATGIADSSILRMLGLGDNKKEVVLTLFPEALQPRVVELLSEFKKKRRFTCGIALLIDVKNIIHHNEDNVQFEATEVKAIRRKTMDSPHTLITCIVNKGNADEVMEAARKAGATGGTVLAARGTGKEEDQKFFGIQLVPEKDLLLILVGSGLTGQVLEAIREVPSLAQPGSGIAFCTDVERFMTLGGKPSM
ncbi:MAG: P-II family nitrogen regulator [Sphaerochaetaceae bacterium]